MTWASSLVMGSIRLPVPAGRMAHFPSTADSEDFEANSQVRSRCATASPKTRTSTIMKQTAEEAVRKAAKQLAEKQDTRQ
jgi:hypothetical protein